MAAAESGEKTGAGAPLPSRSFPLLNSDWGLGSPGSAGWGKEGRTELEFLESEDWLWKASLVLGGTGGGDSLGKVTGPGRGSALHKNKDRVVGKRQERGVRGGADGSRC